MMNGKLGRRDLIKAAAAGTSLGLLGGGPVKAQSDLLAELVGDKLRKIIPAKPLNLVRTVATIMRLEREADTKRLPNSILSFNTGQPIAPVETSIYRASVPRLVALIDRAEGEDPGMADQAGEILAEVHAAQHVVPEALKPAVADPKLPMLRGHNYAVLKPEYARLFETTELRGDTADTANWYLSMMKKARARYTQVGDSVAVPWYFIAAIHGLEASFNFRAHLHNGDYPLSSRTRQVPSGRPSIWLPPVDWESSAKDALKLLGFANQKDWSLERTLYRLEAYNGFGYRRRGVASPYLWSFSNHYERGKFVADGSWNARARSQQCGAAVMLKLLTNAGEIPEFGSKAVAPTKPPEPAPPSPVPQAPVPATPIPPADAIPTPAPLPPETPS